jgi:hypothetical protein
MEDFSAMLESAKLPVSKQYDDVALHEVDFEWVDACTDARKMRHALRLLEPEAGSYPDLYKRAQAKMRELDPLRGGGGAHGLPEGPSRGDVADALADILSFTRNIKSLDTSLSEAGASSAHASHSAAAAAAPAAAGSAPLSSAAARQAACARAKALGNDHFRSREYAAAVSQYTTAIALAPAPRVELLTNRAAALLRTTAWGRAEADALAALALDRHWPRAWLRLAAARQGMGLWSEAAAALHAGIAVLAAPAGTVPASADRPPQSAADTAAELTRAQSKLAEVVEAWAERDPFAIKAYQADLSPGGKGGWVPAVPITDAFAAPFLRAAAPAKGADAEAEAEAAAGGGEFDDDDAALADAAAEAAVAAAAAADKKKKERERRVKPKASAPVQRGGVVIEEVSESESGEEEEVMPVKIAAASKHAAVTAAAQRTAASHNMKKLAVLDDDDDQEEEEAGADDEEEVPSTIRKK